MKFFADIRIHDDYLIEVLIGEDYIEFFTDMNEALAHIKFHYEKGKNGC